MAIGFRKSLMGFNCGDVMNYIEKSHKSFAEKEKELNDRLDSLAAELQLSKANCEKLNTEKDAISEKLNGFTEKYDEIERLSENIGKLYLVAQANAQAIVANSEESARLSGKEVENNLTVIDEAQISLDELRKDILKTSNEFVSEVDVLINSLCETRERISVNTAKSNDSKNSFDEVYKSLVK